MKNQVYLFYDVAMMRYYIDRMNVKYKWLMLTELEDIITQYEDICKWCEKNKDTLLFITIKKGWLGSPGISIERRVTVIDYPKVRTECVLYDTLGIALNTPLLYNMCVNGAILVSREWMKQYKIHEAVLCVYEHGRQTNKIVINIGE